MRRPASPGLASQATGYPRRPVRSPLLDRVSAQLSVAGRIERSVGGQQILDSKLSPHRPPSEYTVDDPAADSYHHNYVKSQRFHDPRVLSSSVVYG